MQNPLGFFIDLLQQPIWVAVWVVGLMIINLLSIRFWDEILAKLIFMTFMVSTILMMALYSIYGFEKILGLGHILWLPLLGYVLIKRPLAKGRFKVYLIVWTLMIAASLIFDIADVYQYLSGSTS